MASDVAFLFYIYSTLAVCLVSNTDAQSIADVNELKSKLMLNYNRNTLPMNDVSSKRFTLHIGVILKSIGKLDEVNEKLSTIMGFYLSWTDGSMVWDSSANNITGIIMDGHYMWRPILSVLNPHHSQNTYTGSNTEAGALINYNSEGFCEWFHMIPVHTTCDMDTTMFPFDKQVCHIHMFVSGNDAYFIETKPVFTKDHLVLFGGNGMWTISNYSIKGSNSSTFQVTYELTRKYLYVLLNILVPILMLSLLTPLVFLLPSESGGERVGYSITTLLAISVYMIIISDNLPNNSQPMALFSIILFVWYVMNSSNIFVVILNIKFYRNDDAEPVPKLAVAFVNIMRRTCCMRKRVKHIGTDRKGSKSENQETNGNEIEDEVETGPAKVTWKQFSRALDRFFLIAFYAVKILLAVVFLAIASSN